MNSGPKRSAKASDTVSNGQRVIPQPVQKALSLGWSVIPQLASKVSYVPWKEWQDKPPPTDRVRRWVAEFPDALWAVVTGQVSGVVVLDFDGEEGRETLDRLALKSTMRTPSGGYHVYVRAPDWPVRGGARVDPEQFPGMDLRADGQVATFYGERDGESYQKQKGKKLYSFADLPQSVQTLLRDRERHPAPEPTPLPDGFDGFESDEPLLGEAIELWTENGSREAGGFHLACQLRDERLDEREGEGAVMEVGRRYVETVTGLGDHPYTLQEFYNSWRSALTWPRRAPRSLGDGLAYFPQTDLGNAERLVALHGEDLRYCHPWGAWLVWDGRRWKRDATAEAERRAKLTVRETYRSAADLESKEARDRLLKWARRSESSSKLRAMLTLAESDEAIAVEPDRLDVDPWVLNTLSGTLDLRTGELRDHDPSDLLTKLAPNVYRPDAAASRWDQFLREVMPDEEDRAFLRRAVGYSLTGAVSEHVLFLLHGTGRNGKSTFLEVLRGVLGDYSQQAPSELLLASKRSGGGPSEEVARLRGARFVATSETEEGRRLGEALIKQLTGGDTLVARFAYGHLFEFKPTHKLWLATNHLPTVFGTDEAIWSRIRQVPFTVQIPKDRQDPDLKSKLLDEAPGILRWAVEGCLEWQRDGLGESANVIQATEDYREGSDVLGRFLEQRCVVGAGHEVTSAALYRAYETWAMQEGLKPMPNITLGQKLGSRPEGFESVKLDGGNARGWRGIGLKGSTSNVKAQVHSKPHIRVVPDEDGEASA